MVRARWILVGLVTSSIALSSCSVSQLPATSAENDACVGLGVALGDIRHDVPNPYSFWKSLGGAARASGDPAIASAGNKMMLDLNKGLAGGTMIKFLVALHQFTLACDALNWGSGGNPVTQLSK